MEISTNNKVEKNTQFGYNIRRVKTPGSVRPETLKTAAERGAALLDTDAHFNSKINEPITSVDEIIQA